MEPNNLSTSTPTVNALANPAAFRYTPRRPALNLQQQAILQTGKQVPLSISRDNKSVIAVPGAFVRVLQHYSGLARERLSQESTSGLTLPDEDHIAVAWAYKYMLAGETEVAGEPFNLLSIGHLASLHSACETLQYEYLANMAFNRAKILIRSEGCWDAHSVSKVCELLPVLKNNLVTVIAFGITEYDTPLDAPHVQKMVEKGLGDQLFRAVEKRRAWLRENALTHPFRFGMWRSVKCYGCGQIGHIRKNCTAESNQQMHPTCHYCNKVGHIKRNCWVRRQVTNSLLRGHDNTSGPIGLTYA